MHFIQHHTTIPIPRLYAIYTDPCDHSTYIIMERIPGDTLASLWPQMNDIGKTLISKRLREHMDQLRSLPAPGGRYGSLHNRGLLDGVFWTGNSKNAPAIQGPFDTEEEFNSAMIEKFRFNCALPEKARFYARTFPRIFRDHPPTFTHGDFQRKNIMVRGSGSREAQPLEERELVLVDWECSGWYPSYWEYGKALCACGRWDDDWHHYLTNSLDEYPVEWAYFSNLYGELWS